MAFTFGFFSDPALTAPIAHRIPFVQAVTGPVLAERVVWFGSPVVGKTCRAVAGNITITPNDAATGSGSPAGDVRLALSSAGLSSAVGGAALSLGAEVLGGAAYAVAIHIGVLDSTHVAGATTDLSLQTNPLAQT